MITPNDLKEESQRIKESNLVERLNVRDQQFASSQKSNNLQYPICKDSSGPTDYKETSSRTI
jgi:hypothetical protein